MRIYSQAARTHCTTNSTLRQLVLLLIPHVTQIQNTTVSSLQLVIGNSLGAPMNNVLYVSQVSILYTYMQLKYAASKCNGTNALN